MPDINAEALEQIIQSAKEDFQEGRFKNAIKGFESARQFFLENEDSVNAAEMANNLSVAYIQDKQGKKALDIVQGTDAIFEQAGEVQKQAVALGNIGAALEAQKDLKGAAEAYQKSADLFGEIGEMEMFSPS